MEPNEAHELQEHHAEAAHDKSLRPVAFAMSLLAVLVAIATVLGHREHTEAVLSQARASDQWALYQAKKIRQSDTLLISDLLNVLAVRDQTAATRLAAGYRAHTEKWNSDLEEEEHQAREFEAEVRLAERRANRFDLGEALLEIGLVATSITLLTRQRAYAYLGGALGLIGVGLAVAAFLVH